MTALTLVHASETVTVEAPEPVCRWLAAFLAPAWRQAPDVGNGSIRICLSAAVTAPSRPGAERVAFVLDRRPVRLAVSENAGAMVCLDPELRVAYAVAGEGHRTTVHSGTHDGLTRIALMRVVREYAHNALLDSGGLVLHAAAFAGPRGAVIVMGPKGAGKTTLLARLLGPTGLTYLANDRVGVTPGQRHAQSIPTIVAVRPGTRRLLPELGRRLGLLGHVTAVAAPTDEPPERTTESWHFAPREFADALSCDMRAAAPLAAFVALRPDAPPDPLLRQMPPDEAVDEICGSLLGAPSRVYVSEIFRTASPVAHLSGQLQAACRRLATDVPCFSLAAPASFAPATLEALSALCL